jgi:hypothetical protein
VEAELVGDFRERSAINAVADLIRKRVVTDWKEVMTMATHAHDRDEWPLAIPVSLIATEGIARGQLGMRPYRIQSSTGSVAKKVRKILAPFGSMAPPAAAALLTVFTGLGGRTSDPTVLKRNAVLHGEQLVIGSERESIQCFLALDMLVCLLDIRLSRASSPGRSA